MASRPPAASGSITRFAFIVVAATAVLSGNNYAAAQTAANLLLVVNSASPTSEAIGRAYAARRAVPQDNVCRVYSPTTETIAREIYTKQIEAPIWKCLSAIRGQDRVLYIVLTKDIPLRIAGTAGRTGTVSSVDSELTLLYRRRTGREVPVVGFVPNPYFAGGTSPQAIKPFSHDAYDIYLVTRLDGYTQHDAEALIERGAAPTAEGRFVLDGRGALVDSGGDTWLRTAAERLRALGLGDRVMLDETSTVVTKQSNVIGYYSWGSNDPAFRQRHYGFEFVPGALAATFVSTDARTVKEPPIDWAPTNAATRESIYAGSHQSLIADLIRDGATGVAGHVDEPYLDGTIRPDVLFPAYASGRNLAEAFYAAMPYLSWQTIVFGDPLCAPFQRAPRPSQDFDPGFDFRAELPVAFAGRRLAAMSPAAKAESALAYARYESRATRNDAAGAQQALEAAVLADPLFTEARLELAKAQEAAGQTDRAIANYEAIVNVRPTETTALNNLAYALATKRGKPADALPYAERAATLAKSDPAIVDTLAWIQHLANHDRDAATTIRTVLALGAPDPEMLWHAAVIFAANNDVARANAQLTAALKADPDLEKRDEVKKLKQQLGGGEK